MRKLAIAMLGMVAVLFGSCSNEEPIGHSGNGERLKISVQIPTLGGENTTRAGVAFEEGENTLKSLYLLFFAPTADGSGQFIDYVNVPMPENDPAIPEDDIFEMNIDTEVTIADPLSSANAYNILALGNVMDDFYVDGTVEAWMAQWAAKTENEVTATALATLPTAITANSLLMHGRMEKPAGETQVHVTLERDVARFDVINNARSTHDLVTASIWNGYGATSIWGENTLDYSAAGPRTRFHYTVNNDGNIRENEIDILDDIKGGLYAFENRVSTPEANDALTTCLIVGLRNRSTQQVGYYRVNMTDDAGAQILHRNDVYSLSISAVTGDGAPDEETAYLGRSNQLIYTIGNWVIDDNGLVVRDDYSILSIPTKKVTIGKDAKTVEISVNTFSTLASPAPLAVRSQTYRPVGNAIQASLDGNTLVIDATALGLDETERSGVIVLSYAGLEISLDVVQSGVHDDFLYVTLPDGGIPRFPAYSGISSGLINVQASGPWTAKMYLGGFSFNPSTALTPVMEMKSTDNLVIPDEEDSSIRKFRIYTHSFNTTQAAREEIIFITLDKDPDVYQSIVLVSQDYVKKLNITLPNADGDWDSGATQQETASALFTGAGPLATTAGNFNKFFVVSGRDDSNNILPWGASIVMNGLTDDSQYFEVTGTYHDAVNLGGNYVTVKAKGLNTTGRELKATLRVQTDPGTFADITLIQQPAEWNVPTVTTAVPAKGGKTDTLKLDAFPGAHYTVEIASVSGVNSDHWAYVTTAGSDTTHYSKLQPLGTEESFMVGFPKMIYPNLYSPASATVKVTLVESGESKMFTVIQNAPAQKAVNLFNVGLDWGGVSNNANKPAFTYNGTNWYGYYCAAWADSFGNRNNFGTSGMVKITTPYIGLASAENGNFTSVWGDVQNSVSIIHFTRPAEYNTSTDWNNANSSIWAWINGTGDYAGNEGVLVVNAEGASATESERDFDKVNALYIPGKMGLSGGFQGTYSWGLSTAENRIMDYLTKTGPFGAQTNMNLPWNSAGNSSYMTIESVNAIEGAVPVLVGSGETWCSLMIDPKRRIVVKTDSEMFSEVGEMAGFGQNLQAWIVNTAQYGTHFSEYFWDSPRYLESRPQPQPETQP
jgi:hypothetical protein